MKNKNGFSESVMYHVKLSLYAFNILMETSIFGRGH